MARPLPPVGTDVPATELVTPDALVVATGAWTDGACWATPPTVLVTVPGLVTAVVPAVAGGTVRASAPVVAPTPTTSAASDQFDNRRMRLSPLSRTDMAACRLDSRLGRGISAYL
jgi:hypothetical protein